MGRGEEKQYGPGEEDADMVQETAYLAGGSDGEEATRWGFCSPAPGGGWNPRFTDVGPDGVITTTPYCHFIWMLFLTPLIVQGSAGNQGRDLPFGAAVVL